MPSVVESILVVGGVRKQFSQPIMLIRLCLAKEAWVGIDIVERFGIWESFDEHYITGNDRL